jgi:hypothetical protein
MMGISSARLGRWKWFVGSANPAGSVAMRAISSRNVAVPSPFSAKSVKVLADCFGLDIAPITGKPAVVSVPSGI